MPNDDGQNAPATPPVVLIAFHRPDVTRRVIEAVREGRPRQLFVIADGPRTAGQETDRTNEVRALVDELVDWPCEVVRHFSDVNLGCEANVELGLDAVFAVVDRAIVLEDDCVPDPSFFAYAAVLLERYATDQRVWQVSGGNFGVPEAAFDGRSYAFTSWGSVWGWATWADRWQEHRRLFPRDHQPSHAPVRTHPVVIAPGALVTREALRHFEEAAVSDDVVTHGWDKHWWLSMMTRGGLVASPAHNVVENIGFGADATHTVATGQRYGSARPADVPLRHPVDVTLDRTAEREIELVLNRVGGRAARMARRVVRSPRLRGWARTAVDSRAMTATARAVSRMTDRRSEGAGPGR